MAQRVDVQYIRFYTDGSAAKKVTPVVPLKTLRLPKLKLKKRLVLHIDPIALGGILMAGLMLILMTVGVFKLAAARQELKTMQSYVDTLQQTNQTLSTTLSQGYDLGEIEKTARALGMVPKEQVEHITLSVPEAVQPEPESPFGSFYTFLTGLFA